MARKNTKAERQDDSSPTENTEYSEGEQEDPSNHAKMNESGIGVYSRCTQGFVKPFHLYGFSVRFFATSAVKDACFHALAFLRALRG
jgi:hypothetical protein